MATIDTQKIDYDNGTRITFTDKDVIVFIDVMNDSTPEELSGLLKIAANSISNRISAGFIRNRKKRRKPIKVWG